MEVRNRNYLQSVSFGGYGGGGREGLGARGWGARGGGCREKAIVEIIFLCGW